MKSIGILYARYEHYGIKFMLLPSFLQVGLNTFQHAFLIEYIKTTLMLLTMNCFIRFILVSIFHLLPIKTIMLFKVAKLIHNNYFQKTN